MRRSKHVRDHFSFAEEATVLDAAFDVERTVISRWMCRSTAYQWWTLVVVVDASYSWQFRTKVFTREKQILLEENCSRMIIIITIHQNDKHDGRRESRKTFRSLLFSSLSLAQRRKDDVEDGLADVCRFVSMMKKYLLVFRSLLSPTSIDLSLHLVSLFISVDGRQEGEDLANIQSIKKETSLINRRY